MPFVSADHPNRMCTTPMRRRSVIVVAFFIAANANAQTDATGGGASRWFGAVTAIHRYG